MSEPDLDAIQARCDAATEPPWYVDQNHLMWQLFGGRGPMSMQLAKCGKRDTPYAEYWPGPADEAFIVHARTDLPAVVRALREAREEIRVLREALDGIVHAGETLRAADTDWLVLDMRDRAIQGIADADALNQKGKIDG